MTTRERLRRVFRFEKPDRLPIIEWATWWDKTVERFYAEGLDPKADIFEALGVEELLQDCRGRDRQGKERQLIPDGAVQHVDLMLFDCSFHDLSHFFLFSA